MRIEQKEERAANNFVLNNRMTKANRMRVLGCFESFPFSFPEHFSSASREFRITLNHQFRK